MNESPLLALRYAVSVARTLSSKTESAEVLSRVAKAYSKFGDRATAKSLLTEVGELLQSEAPPSARVIVLAELALAWWKVGAHDEALNVLGEARKVAELLVAGLFDCGAVARLAQVFALIGLDQECMEVGDLVKDRHLKGALIFAVCMSLVQDGDLERALNYTNSIGDNSLRAKVYVEVLLKAEELEHASPLRKHALEQAAADQSALL